jgi:hypothetical protein
LPPPSQHAWWSGKQPLPLPAVAGGAP